MKTIKKLFIFNRLQQLLRKMKEDCCDAVVCVKTDYGNLFHRETCQHTDELNEILTQIRDFGKGDNA